MIRIRCDRANAYLQETETLTAGMVNLPTVQFTFSEDWDGYGKTAVVRAGNVRVEVLLIEDAITVPAECLEVAGVNLIIGVYGADSTHELPTVWCACGEILDGTDINSAINHVEATHSNVDQMLEYAASIEAYAEDLDENVIREVEADDTNANQYGTVGVDITDDHDPDSRKLTFTFTNLKGNGIETLNIIDDEEDPNYGKLQIRQSNGTIQNFSGLKDAIDSIDGLEEDIESAEAARVIAETGRTTAEATRVTNESDRNRAEGVREQNEAARAAAEEDRVELFDHVSEMTADAETLAAGSYATAEKQVDSSGNINFHFGIPKGDKGTKGDKGNKGDKGDKGDTGAVPDFSIGTVTTGAAGTDASATITGTDAAPVLNLTIPRGNTGEISEAQFNPVKNAVSKNGTYIIAPGTGDSSAILNSISGTNANTASGTYSFAEGYHTQAIAHAAHAEGSGAKATFAAAHAEGSGTKASNANAHAEGSGTTASGIQSHAEGGGAQASGANSHAEGGGTTASGTCAHAEGSVTTASGDQSHAEGGNTTASGAQAHAEGGGTKASGQSSHAEGYQSEAKTWGDHSEGFGTEANGKAPTGYASGAHAEGAWSKALAIAAHAEGYITTASGENSHAEGKETIATRRSQHVFGEYNIAETGIGATRGTYVEIVGKGTSSSARSNARTLDWSGNEVLAGNLTAAGGSITVGQTTFTENQLSAVNDIEKITDVIGNLFSDAEAMSGATGITRVNGSEYVGTASAFQTFLLNNYTLDPSADSYVIAFDIYTEANSSSSGTGLEVQYGNHSSKSTLASFDNDQTDPYHFESFFSVTYSPTAADKSLGLVFKANSATSNIWHVSNIRLFEGMEIPDAVTAKDIDAREKVDEAVKDLEDLKSSIDSVVENSSTNVLVLKPKTETKNGVTLTVTNDSISVSGTATANAYFYDFFNNNDFVGTFTFGRYDISGTGLLIIQVPYNENITNRLTKTFETAPTAQIAVTNGTTIDIEVRFWACQGEELFPYEQNVKQTIREIAFADETIDGNSLVTKSVPVSALDVSENVPNTNLLNIPDVYNAIYKGSTYSIVDNVITINGTPTSGLAIKLPNMTLTGYNAFNFEVISGSYTGTLMFQLPIATGWITSLARTTTRIGYFDGTETTMQLYAYANTVFNNFKIRIWVTKGLIPYPFNKPLYVVPSLDTKTVTLAEYNAPEYARIADGFTYNVFGKYSTICKNGMIGRSDRTDLAKFAVLADLHYTDSEDFYSRIYQQIRKKDVDFCLLLGDILDSGYYSTPALYNGQVTQYKNSMKYIGCPSFPFAGNHDADVREFARHGVIDYGSIRIIYFWADYMTTTENPAGHTGDVKPTELDWLEDQLEESTAEINILSCHYPISDDEGFTTYFVDASTISAIETLAQTYNVKLYLNGHQHDHNISVGSAGVLTDINLPNGKYAYSICTIDNSGLFTLKAYDAESDTELKTITVNLN